MKSGPFHTGAFSWLKYTFHPGAFSWLKYTFHPGAFSWLTYKFHTGAFSWPKYPTHGSMLHAEAFMRLFFPFTHSFKTFLQQPKLSYSLDVDKRTNCGSIQIRNWYHHGTCGCHMPDANAFQDIEECQDPRNLAQP